MVHDPILPVDKPVGTTKDSGLRGPAIETQRHLFHLVAISYNAILFCGY